MKAVIGIDIGGTNTKIGLITESGMTMGYDSFPTNSHESITIFIQKIKQTTDNLIQKNHDIEIIGIGIGCPNADSRSGQLISPPNLGWGSIPLKKLLKEIFKYPIYIGNDANVAAYGEKIWGAAKGMRDFIVVTLGTGIGTGIFVNDSILIGHNALAGEGGHLIIEPNGRKCSCGGYGHLECYGSVRGIKETVREMTGEDLKFKEIATRYINNEKVFLEAFSKTADYLGRGLADLGTLFAPEAIILAGGIATVGENFKSMVENSFKKYVFPPFIGTTKILLSEIATEHGAVLGAASQVFFHH